MAPRRVSRRNQTKGTRRAASSKIRPVVGQRKGATRSRRFGWLVLAVVLLLVVGVSGVLVFQGENRGTGGTPPLAVLRTEDFHSLAFSPDNPEVVFFGHHDGVMRSDNGGKTWRRLVDRRNFDAMALAIDRKNSRLAYLAGHEIFQVSNDGGVTWNPIQHNLPDADIHAFTISPEDSRRLFAFVVGYGLFRSNDSGRTWVNLSTKLSEDVDALASSGGNPETLYIGTGAGLLRSLDGGQTWGPAGRFPGSGSGAVAAVVVDPAAPDTVYAGGEAGLYKSADKGDSWTRLAFPGSNLMVLAISPTQPALMLAIDVVGREGRVYRSIDAGATWGK